MPCFLLRKLVCIFWTEVKLLKQSWPLQVRKKVLPMEVRIAVVFRTGKRKAAMKVSHLGGKRLEEDKSFQDLFRSWLWQVPFLSLQVRSVAERHIEFVLRGQRSTDENFLPSHWLDFDSKSYAAPLDLDELLKSLEPHVSLEKAKNMAVSLKHLLQMIRGKVADLRKSGRMEELRLGVLATLKFTGA